MGAGCTIDTRQQAGKHRHVDDWFTSHGVPFHYEKLDYGDYQRDDGFSNISIDTKQDMDEVAQNIGRDHDRFVRECERARQAGYRLVVLVEQHKDYNDRERIKTWVSGVCRRCIHYRNRDCVPAEVTTRTCMRGYKPLQGPTALKIITTIEGQYGARFMFCNKRETARTICELLGIEYDR